MLKQPEEGVFIGADTDSDSPLVLPQRLPADVAAFSAEVHG